MNLKMKCKTLRSFNSHKLVLSQDQASPRTFKTKTFKFQYRDISKPRLKSRELQAWIWNWFCVYIVVCNEFLLMNF